MVSNIPDINYKLRMIISY